MKAVRVGIWLLVVSSALLVAAQTQEFSLKVLELKGSAEVRLPDGEQRRVKVNEQFPAELRSELTEKAWLSWSGSHTKPESSWLLKRKFNSCQLVPFHFKAVEFGLGRRHRLWANGASLCQFNASKFKLSVRLKPSSASLANPTGQSQFRLIKAVSSLRSERARSQCRNCV